LNFTNNEFAFNRRRRVDYYCRNHRIRIYRRRHRLIFFVSEVVVQDETLLFKIFQFTFYAAGGAGVAAGANKWGGDDQQFETAVLFSDGTWWKKGLLCISPYE
jgi:hypothetical protein